MNIFNKVAEFHEHFGLNLNRRPDLLPPHHLQVRELFLREETIEFIRAHSQADLPGCLDAMIDLIYVASGTLHLMGFTKQQQTEAFKRVHEANLLKRRVRTEKESKRGTLYDVKKPKGWKAPYLRDLCK